jgi:hypothetical protein
MITWQQIAEKKQHKLMTGWMIFQNHNFKVNIQFFGNFVASKVV